MIFKSLTDLPLAGSVSGSDTVVIVQNGVSKLGSVSSLLSSISANVTTVSASGSQGVTVSVTNPSSTPNIAIGLGAISPTSISTLGTITGSNLTGTNTGDQTITLTGSVTGSGTGSFATTITDGAVTAAKIASGAVSFDKVQSVGASKLLGRRSGSSGIMEEITVGSGLSMSGATISATGGGVAAISSITAATTSATIDSGNNTGIVWNWANTVNTTVCFQMGESVASTNGTSVSGVPQQVLLKLATLSSSTMSPLSVFLRGSHVFSVPFNQRQIVGDSGANSNPMYSFAASTGSGMWLRSAGIVSFSAATGVVVGEFISTGIQLPQAQSDTASFSIRFQKNRGSIGAPTVIVTGDTLGQNTYFGYVGGTNTFREAARVQVDSGGTITDANTGIGSVIRLMGTTQGTDSAPQDTVIITGGSTATFQFKGTGMSAANGSVATVLGSVGPVGSNTTVQEWLKVTLPSGTARFIPCF